MKYRVSMALKEPEKKGDEYVFAFRERVRTTPFKHIIAVFDSLGEVVDFIGSNSFDSLQISSL